MALARFNYNSSKSAADFDSVLDNAVASIKKEANGRVCSSCMYFVSGYCNREHPFIDIGYIIKLYRDDAVACSLFKLKRRKK